MLLIFLFCFEFQPCLKYETQKEQLDPNYGFGRWTKNVRVIGIDGPSLLLKTFVLFVCYKDPYRTVFEAICVFQKLLYINQGAHSIVSQKFGFLSSKGPFKVNLSKLKFPQHGFHLQAYEYVGRDQNNQDYKSE